MSDKNTEEDTVSNKLTPQQQTMVENYRKKIQSRPKAPRLAVEQTQGKGISVSYDDEDKAMCALGLLEAFGTTSTDFQSHLMRELLDAACSGNKVAFAKLFGEYLRVENVLQNYDEFASLRALQSIDMNDAEAVESFKAAHHLSDDDLAALKAIKMPAERKIQDYRSTYNDIRDWLRREKAANEKEKSTIDWNDVVFEVDLLKSQEINLDYILEQIFENNRKVKDKAALVEDVRRMIRASLGNRAKESLLVDFINHTDLDKIGDKASVIDAFFAYAQAEQKREAEELISAENLDVEAAKRYLAASIKREFASDNGTELNAILPKMSPLNSQYLTKKQSVFQKIAAFVEKFKGVGWDPLESTCRHASLSIL